MTHAAHAHAGCGAQAQGAGRPKLKLPLVQKLPPQPEAGPVKVQAVVKTGQAEVKCLT